MPKQTFSVLVGALKSDLVRSQAALNDRQSPEYFSLNLGFDRFVLFDLEDASFLMRYRWCAHPRRRSGYDAKAYIGKIDGSDMIVSMQHLLLPDVPTGMVRDHINGNALDNRRSNLRICTYTENSMNSRVRLRNKTSLFKGVSWNKALKMWVARIHIKGEQIPLGNFSDEIEAAEAYDVAARSYYGEFRRVNFPVDASERAA